MPQIGWLEILSVVIIAILVLGPKQFPIALKKIGSYIGKLKNTFNYFQKVVSNVTEEIDLEIDINSSVHFFLLLTFLLASQNLFFVIDTLFKFS